MGVAEWKKVSVKDIVEDNKLSIENFIIDGKPLSSYNMSELQCLIMNMIDNAPSTGGNNEINK